MDRNPGKAELFIVFLHLVKSQEHHTSAFLILSASYGCSIFLLNSLLGGANEEKEGGEDTDIIIPGAIVVCCTNWNSANKIPSLMHNQV